MKRIDAALGSAVVLLAVYLLTLAPDVTFWDAGEFIASAHSLGVPHPPGTPLFVAAINVWAKLFFFLPYAVATNLFSAVATASAAFLTADLVQRAGVVGEIADRRAMAFAAAVCAGSMSSVWLNATETEVYAASLALGVCMVWVGERAGRLRQGRWLYLLAYLIALAVPLHLSALVAAPVAIALVVHGGDGIRWHHVATFGGVFLIAMGVGRMSASVALAGAAIVVGAFAVRKRGGRWRLAAPLPAISALFLVAIGLSALFIMYVRAQFDPGINQGNPSTLHALADVVARRQYAVSPIWPREAPIWLQIANLGQYVDWQAALSFGPTVLPSILRTLATVVFIALGWIGGTSLWRADRRAGIAVFGLLVCGALGVLVYLNLHAGPSIGYGFLPANTIREARERDYFFVFGFWAWGILSGIGAVTFVSRLRRPAWTGALLACLPIALNWRAVTRRGEPEESLPRVVALSLLESTPRNGVLFVAGDNDSYPLWYAQQVLRARPDVAVITMPLLPTDWYRAEIQRRHGLLTEREAQRFEGRLATSTAIANGARRIGRPVAAAITLRPDEREALGKAWTSSGMVYVEGNVPVDTAAARRTSAWVERQLPDTATRPAIDPVHSYFRGLLDCPDQLLRATRTRDASRVDSICNYR